MEAENKPTEGEAFAKRALAFMRSTAYARLNPEDRHLRIALEDIEVDLNTSEETGKYEHWDVLTKGARDRIDQEMTEISGRRQKRDAIVEAFRRTDQFRSLDERDDADAVIAQTLRVGAFDKLPHKVWGEFIALLENKCGPIDTMMHRVLVERLAGRIIHYSTFQADVLESADPALLQRLYAFQNKIGVETSSSSYFTHPQAWWDAPVAEMEELHAALQPIADKEAADLKEATQKRLEEINAPLSGAEAAAAFAEPTIDVKTLLASASLPEGVAEEHPTTERPSLSPDTQHLITYANAVATVMKWDGPSVVDIVYECLEIARGLAHKNKQYGDSALNPLRIFSKASAKEQILVRLDDKVSRLMRGDQSIEDEDVFRDILGYLVLLHVAKRRGEGRTLSLTPPGAAAEPRVYGDDAHMAEVIKKHEEDAAKTPYIPT